MQDLKKILEKQCVHVQCCEDSSTKNNFRKNERLNFRFSLSERRNHPISRLEMFIICWINLINRFTLPEVTGCVFKKRSSSHQQWRLAGGWEPFVESAAQLSLTSHTGENNDELQDRRRWAEVESPPLLHLSSCRCSSPCFHESSHLNDSKSTGWRRFAGDLIDSVVLIDSWISVYINGLIE